MREPSSTVPELVPAIDSNAPRVTTTAPMPPTSAAAASAIGVDVFDRSGSADIAPSRASETTKPFDSEASEVTRASQFIQPVSNPTKSPKAVRAYRYAPPGSLKWLDASAKQSTRMNTGTANSSGAHSENGPRSL